MDTSVASKRLQQLTALWTNLRALLRWWQKYSQWLERGRTDPVALEKAGWYFGALILQADTLFTSRRSGSRQPGAALRALDQLARGDLKALIEEALNVRATHGGRPLRAVVHSMRNEMMVHTNLDFEEYGPALVFLGPQGEEWPAALQGLMQASESVVTALGDEATLVMQEAGRAGALVELFAKAQSAAGRVADRERQSRRRPPIESSGK